MSYEQDTLVDEVGESDPAFLLEPRTPMGEGTIQGRLTLSSNENPESDYEGDLRTANTLESLEKTTIEDYSGV